MAAPVAYDRRSFILNGKPFIILAGSVHYIRLHPSRWQSLFDTFLAANLNTLETYVFWGEHDKTPAGSTDAPTYDFTARLDLFAFLAAAAARGLHVILRIGPYVCAEVSYGGFPARLRDVPGLHFRTFNAPFMREVEAWVRHLARGLRRANLLAPQGGPVILVQLENEYEMVSHAYGDSGASYLQWCADLQRELAFGVPGIMCYGAADGVVETINAFYAHRHVAAHRARHPDQPPVWTECWTGWYDVWGAPHHRRSAEDVAYAVARFFAQGGAGVNYYMWCGGTNFGRTPMYLQTTSYDYDAPVDEFYQETAKARHLAALHRVLLGEFANVFHAEREQDPENGDGRTFRWGNLCFLCNDTEEDMADAVIGGENGERVYDGVVRRKSVHIVNASTGELLFDTAVVSKDNRKRRVRLPVETTCIRDWCVAKEPVPRASIIDSIAEGGPPRIVESSEEPIEQLKLTQDTSDYCFYTARYRRTGKTKLDGRQTAHFEAADYAHVFLDGVAVGRSKEPLWEDRWPNKWNKYDNGKLAPGSSHSIDVEWDSGEEVDVTILTTALGLVKGDWQLGDKRNMLEERKGLLSDVKLVGKENEEEVFARCSPWFAVPKLVGELSEFPREFPPGQARSSSCTSGPAWYRCVLSVKVVAHNWVVDLNDCGKGLLYVNNVLLGRYWGVAGTRPRNGFLDGTPITQDEPGQPTQRYYHVPAWVASENANGAELDFVLFAEYGKVPEKLSLYTMEQKG